MTMNKKMRYAVSVVYNSKTIVDFSYTKISIIPSGLRITSYPLDDDEIKFIGNYLKSGFIISALQDYNPN